jgi:hypothetical protein
MALVFLVGATVGFAQTKPDTSVARSRAKHLRRGFNLSEWFAQVYDAKGYTKEHFQSWNALEDLALIKAMGFDHVRLSVNPKPMWRHNEADEILAEYLGEKWKVPLVCNEFVVCRKVAKAEDRARWLSDVRTSLEKDGIGWTMWDYSSGFGVVVKLNGQASLDEVTVKALGLKVVGTK